MARSQVLAADDFTRLKQPCYLKRGFFARFLGSSKALQAYFSELMLLSVISITLIVNFDHKKPGRVSSVRGDKYHKI